MSRNGSGTFNLLANSWNPAVNGVTATAADWQALINDVAAAITQSVSVDGQAPMTGNLPMGNNKITGLAKGTASTDAANQSQLGNFSAYTNLAVNTALTITHAGQLLAIAANGLTHTLPLAASVPVGTTFTFGTSVSFTLTRSGADLIFGPQGSGSSQKMFSNCSVVNAGTAWAIEMGGDPSTNGTTGRVLLAGGLMPQWGTTTLLLNGAGVGTIAFTALYATAYTVLVCNGDNAATNTAPVVNALTTSNFNVLFPGAGAITVRCNWLALGLSA